jgi:hypothetical protein
MYALVTAATSGGSITEQIELGEDGSASLALSVPGRGRVEVFVQLSESDLLAEELIGS